MHLSYHMNARNEAAHQVADVVKHMGTGSKNRCHRDTELRRMKGAKGRKHAGMYIYYIYMLM